MCVKEGKCKAKKLTQAQIKAALDWLAEHNCAGKSLYVATCAVAQEILKDGGSFASAAEVLRNPCTYLVCSGGTVQFPWSHWNMATIIESFFNYVAEAEGFRAGRLAGETKGYIGKLRSSFVPETEVWMADGTKKPIEDIRAGDEVIAADPLSGKVEIRPVIAVIKSEGEKELVRVTVETGGDYSSRKSEVIATAQHPFWVDDQGHWLAAADLLPGMHLRSSDSGAVTVVDTYRYRRVGQLVYNLTIKGTHTYNEAYS